MYMVDADIIAKAVCEPDGKVYNWLIEHLNTDLCMSALSYGHLEAHVQKSSAPMRNRLALYKLLLGIPVISYDVSAGCCYGEIISKEGRDPLNTRLNVYDDLLRAHARSAGCTLVTTETFA